MENLDLLYSKDNKTAHQARWDKEHKIEANLKKILHELDDEIETALRTLDCSKYKNSMRPLIENDIQELLQMM